MENDHRALPRLTTFSEADLVNRAAAGDGVAFELIMRRHNQHLFHLARAVLRDDAEAEDAVQDAYLQAYLNLARFRGEAKLSTWLARIVINEALQRAQRRSRLVALDSVDERDLSDETSIAGMLRQISRDRPENAAACAEARRLIEEAIDALPESLRLVFVMRAVEQMSVKETSAVLDVSEGAIRTRFHRARRLLKTALTDELAPMLREVFPFFNDRCDRIVDGAVDRIGAGGPVTGPPGAQPAATLHAA